MKGYKIKVMKPYRKLVTNVSRSGYVQRRGSSKPVKFKSRKQAHEALIHIIRHNFPRSINKQSAGYGIMKIAKR
jgi:hypothetical protein